MKFEFQFLVKIDSQSILFAFTHQVLQIRTAKLPLTASTGPILPNFQIFARIYLGNPGQELFYARIKDLEEPVKATGGELLRRLRHLTTSGQPYFMHEGAGVDHAVDSYFSPYDGLIVESVRVANDKIWDLEISVRQFQILKKQRRHLSC